jgi:uncharacterized protein
MEAHENLIKVYESPIAMLAEVQDWLEKDAAKNNLLLGLLYRLAKRERAGGEVPATLVAVFEGEAPKLVFLHMPGRSEMIMVAEDQGYESAVVAAARYFKERGDDIVGIVGPEPQNSQFASLYAPNFGVHFKQNVMQLDQLKPVRPTLGRMRLARPDDMLLVASWISAFFKESLNRPLELDEAKRLAQAKILEKSICVWDNEGLVSMAGLERPTLSGITVVLVYTPVEARGKGYASNLVATMTKAQLTAGRKFLCLHTDADFPTSNRIYADMGYYIVGTGSILNFIQD